VIALYALCVPNDVSEPFLADALKKQRLVTPWLVVTGVVGSESMNFERIVTGISAGRYVVGNRYPNTPSERGKESFSC
jgi:hypothetical protein